MVCRENFAFVTKENDLFFFSIIEMFTEQDIDVF